MRCAPQLGHVGRSAWPIRYFAPAPKFRQFKKLGSARNLRDVPAGILEGDEPATARQRYWIVKRSFPAPIHRARQSNP
jgi:hypothetical protein